MAISSCSSTFGHLRDDPKVVVLPASTASPVEIEVRPSGGAGDLRVQLSYYCDAEFHWTKAADQATADTKIASDTTRGKRPAGNYSFPLVGLTDNIYFRSTAAAGTISYVFVEGDRF